MKQLALYRIVRIVWMSIVFFVQVTSFQRRHRGRFTPAVNAKWEQLVTRQARIYKKTALELGGLMIKLGQFLSARADIMPPSFLEELEGLTDQVTPVPTAEALAVLDDEWKIHHQEILKEMSDVPIASASIGEVYKARLNDGSQVAVKIQRPNIERILRADFKAIKIVIWLAKRFTNFSKQIDFDLLYIEMTDVIGAELNFLQEMKNGRSFAERFPNMEGVRFPVYFDEYTTRRVLVMEWIEGVRITDTAFLEEHGIDRKELSVRLFLLFLEQVLEGGQFHADPHSGNLMVQEDGTLVLIDFGMVVTISPAEADSMFLIVEGIIFKQYDRVLDGLEQLKFLLPDADRTLLASAIERVVKAYESDDLNDMNGFVVERLLEDLMQIVRTQPVQMPAQFAFLGRAVSVFVGVLHILDPNVDLLGIGKERVMEWAKHKTGIGGGNRFSSKGLSNAALSAIGQVRDIPPRIYSFLDEPKRMREYTERHDKERDRQRVRLQTRNFAGIFGAISLAALFFGIWDEHTPMIIASGSVMMGSFLVFWRKGK
ncbi:ABC1 kinase family protein [Sporosarcina gallistercoris]|uniref:AarF/ABC1/UbiB kinase family protein n=1 Tax=Sporosarcina gallistercoris TaxID=2762245 RepID=A0ABR8PIX0_9BACL|nr:AarF/UbiB family protein [Sporosarcina gallistercoris]MBD7908107.1 AarF/ABC1/UbiB kinase family protein [Sporosarcina gallistercoris]